MPITVSNEQPACACAHTQSRHCARSHSGGGAARALAVRAPCRAGCSRPVPFERELHQRDTSALWCKAALRRARYGLQQAAGLRVCAHAIAPLCYLSLGRRRSKCACGAHAPCRAGCSRSVLFTRALHQREASTLRCNAVLRHASRGIQQAAGLRVCAHTIAPLRSLSLGRRRSTRARRARAPCHTCCTRSVTFERAHHQREASTLRRKTVLRRESQHFQRAAGLRVCIHAIATLRSLSLGRRRSTRARRAPAPRRAGRSRSVSYGRPLLQREGSLLRCKAVLRRASRGLSAQPACACAHTQNAIEAGRAA